MARLPPALAHVWVMESGATEVGRQLYQTEFFRSNPKEKGKMEPVRLTEGAHMVPTPAPSENS